MHEFYAFVSEHPWLSTFWLLVASATVASVAESIARCFR